MEFSNYIIPAVSAGVYLVFLMVKRIIPKEYRKYIPIGAGLLGVVFIVWYKHELTFATFLEGLASGLGATGIDNAVSMNEEKIKVYDPKDEGLS